MASKEVDQGQKSGGNDRLKWVLVWLLVAAGCVANWHFQSVSGPVRMAVGIVLLVLVVLAFAWTAKGQRSWGFVKGARQELRRVHWLGRQEVIQTTVRVLIVVLIAALVLWLFDALFMWAMGLLSG